MDGKAWIHPDSVAADQKHTFKVLALDAKTGKIALGAHRLRRPGLRRAAPRAAASPGRPPATDGAMVFAYFGPEGLYAYDVNGKLAWKAVEPFATLGLGTGHLAGALSRTWSSSSATRTTASTRRSWPTTSRPARKSWTHEARRADHAGATPVLVEAGGRTELVTNGNEFVIAYDPATGKELWRTHGRREQRHPHAARRPRAGDRDGRLPGEESHRAPARRRRRRPARRLGIRARAPATCSRTSSTATISTCLPTTASSPASIRRPGAVKYEGRPRAGAGAVHGLAGRVRRLRRADERGRRHVHAEGRPDARDRPHQLGRRAGLFVAGDRQRPDLHPRSTSTCSRLAGESLRGAVHCSAAFMSTAPAARCGLRPRRRHDDTTTTTLVTRATGHDRCGRVVRACPCNISGSVSWQPAGFRPAGRSEGLSGSQAASAKTWLLVIRSALTPAPREARCCQWSESVEVTQDFVVVVVSSSRCARPQQAP